MADLAVVAAVAGGTLLMRSSLVALFANATIPAWLERALRLVAPAVLAGLVAQTLFLEGGEFRAFDSWYVAAAVATMAAVVTRSIGWTLVVGMLSVWVLQAALP